MKLLIIEDEKDLFDSLITYFEQAGYVCEGALTHDKGSEKINLYEYDCVFLDLNLPDGNGLDIIPLIKEKSPDTAIIILSARNSIDDRITGLNLGADDYVVKPFHMAELNARLNSVIRRISFEGNNLIEIGHIIIDPAERIVRIGKDSLDLTRKEYDLLMFFVMNKNRVLTKESIGEHLWGDYMDNADSFDFVYSHIKNLRKKIQKAAGEDYIRTIYGVGYKLIAT